MFQNNHKLLAFFATLLLGFLANPTASRAQTLQIDSSTANWIEGFADFVHWEGDEKAERISIGIIGSPEVANYLRRRADERTSKPRLHVITLGPSDSFTGIDILFVGGATRRSWHEIVAKCAGNRTLSISNQAGFAEAGGCVEFLVRKNRLCFYIDQNHARTHGVVISSKLLELAIEPKR